MIWDNVWIMSAIDVTVVAIVVVMLWRLWPRRRGSSEPMFGLLLISLGVLLTGLFYIADLFTMHLLPSLIGMPRAMQAMESLHLNVRWIVTLASLVMIFVGFMRVIREREAAAELLRQAQKRELVGELASGVAHDYNNILAVIVGNAELALEQLPDSHPARADLEGILQAASRSSKVTRQLLSFSRRDRLEPQPIDINELIRRAEPMLRSAVDGKAVLRIMLADRIDAVKADADKLEQVLLNLVINARDSVEEDGQIRVATLQLEPRDSADSGDDSDGEASVMLSVTDNGCGMDENTRQQIIEPFFTTKSARGTGLGLSMAQGIVAQSGGQIQVDTARGRGTSVSIKLPAAMGPAVSLADLAVPETETSGDNRRSVLVVDDQDMVRQLAVRSLKKLGYRVFEACNGEEALALYLSNSSRIDVVLTDVRMPGRS